MSSAYNRLNDSEGHPNQEVLARMTTLLRSTELGILIETPEPVDTINEIVRWAITEPAKNLGLKWGNERPEIITSSFISYPQEYRLLAGEQITKSGGTMGVTYKTPVEGNGDFDPANPGGHKVLAYGNPVDIDDPRYLEDIPEETLGRIPGATKQCTFAAKMNADGVLKTLLKSMRDFNSTTNERGRIYVIRAAEQFLSFTPFVEMVSEIIDYCRHSVTNGLGIVLLVPSNYTQLPNSLKEGIFTNKWSRPNKSYWRQTISSFVNNKQIKMDVNNKGEPIPGISQIELERVATALSGLTRGRGEAACLASYTACSIIDTNIILNEKRSQIQDYGLNLMVPDPDEKVGGMSAYKQFVAEETEAGLPDAKAFGVKTTKMVLFGGPSGTGKTVGVKALANDTGRPIVNVGATTIRTKYVGEGENRLKTAIDIASTMSGILFIDEIEKLIATGRNDSGSTDGSLSVLLTEIQENKSDIMFAFTANHVELLPPEFINRADVKFLFNLPRADERLEILKIHIALAKKLEKNGWIMRDPEDYPLDKLVEATEGFDGRQIHNAMKSTIRIAWSRTHGDEPTIDDFLNAIKRHDQNSTPEEEMKIIIDNCKARGFISANGETEAQSDEVDYSSVRMT